MVLQGTKGKLGTIDVAMYGPHEPGGPQGGCTTKSPSNFFHVWSKISNALKRLGFRSRNFLAQLLSETSRAGTNPGSTIKFREALE